MTDTTIKRRGRGRPPRVSRASIIAAAQEIAPDQLSMQAVADRLGVDRSTINYHFTDRDELFSVVAAVTFSAEMTRYRSPESDDWRDWVTGYARAVHSALRKHPEMASYVRLQRGADLAVFEPVEGLISTMLGAGFDEVTVVQAVSYIASVVHISAQDEIIIESGTHPQGLELLGFLEEQPAEAIPGIRRLVEIDPLRHPNHFEFALGMIVAGLESRLPER